MVKFEAAFILKEKIYEAIGRIKERYPRVASHPKDALAIKVYPPSSKELTFTYVDWNPELYKMDISFEMDDKVSDSQTLTSGIRNFMSKKVNGYRQFYTNDEKVLIRGGGYTWDITIRFSIEGRIFFFPPIKLSFG